jgi:Na+/H+ antiporter NhaA
MATDIAFALGALAIVAPRAPNGLEVFLTALAIVDDLGAIVVIALFYSEEVAWAPLAQGGMVAVLLALLNLLGVRRLLPYLTLGMVLWLLLHESGVTPRSRASCSHSRFRRERGSMRASFPGRHEIWWTSSIEPKPVICW